MLAALATCTNTSEHLSFNSTHYKVEYQMYLSSDITQFPIAADIAIIVCAIVLIGCMVYMTRGKK